MCWYNAYSIDGLKSSGGQPYASTHIRWHPSRYQKNGYIYSFRKLVDGDCIHTQLWEF